MKLEKAIRILLLVIFVLSTLALSGCIYSHNYEVDEAVDDIRKSIEAEINNALSSD